MGTINSNKITESGYENLKAWLPYTATSQIHKKLKSKVSKRLIQLVLSGMAEDYHGILAIALKLAQAEKAKKTKLNKKLKAI